MVTLIVGVGRVSLMLRHSRSLKDKRQVVKSVSQRLKNQGFSVTEIAYGENAKQAGIGFAYVGTSVSAVEHALAEGLKLFIGEEIVSSDKEVFDYSSDLAETFPWEEDSV